MTLYAFPTAQTAADQSADVGPLGNAFAVLYLAAFAFTIWMWIDAVGTPGAFWKRVGRDKVKFFVIWYITGFLTLGLVSMGMAIWYYRSIRPQLQEVRRVQERGLLTPAWGAAPSNNPAIPASWYPDPRNEARLRYWDGTRWTEHTAT